MAEDQDNVKSALQLLYELEGRDYAPAPEQKPQPTFDLKPLDENSMRYGETEDVKPSTMSYPEQMKNVWETVKPTQQGSKDAAAIAASSIYGAPMDIMGLLHGAREIVKGRIPEQSEMELPGGSHYLEERAKKVGTLSQEPSGAAQATGIIGSIVADPLAAAGKLGTLAAAVPAAAKGTNAVEKALTTAQRELSPLGLYSQSAEVAGKLKQPDTPQAILSYLTKNGANKEELIAAGILDDLGAPSKEFLAQARVNPSELVSKIQSSFPEISETLLESPKYTTEKYFEPIFPYPDGVGGISLGRHASREEAEAVAQAYAERHPQLEPYRMHEFEQQTPIPIKHEVEFGPKRYPNATTEGGENYRELLLQAPLEKSEPKEVFKVNIPGYQSLAGEATYATAEEANARIKWIREQILENVRNDTNGTHADWYNNLLKATDNARVQPIRDPDFVNPNYVDGHYGRNYPNVVAHIRMQDIPDAETGRKVLRIEEIQSDWAQTGSKAGFKMSEAELKAAKERANKLSEQISELDDQAAGLFGIEGYASPEYAATKKKSEDLSKQLQNLMGQINANQSGKALPANQYVKNTEKWTDLAVKRALKEAADNPDYSKMQLTAGSVQYERWGKSKNAQGVANYYDTKLKSSLEKWVKKLDPEAKVEKKSYDAGNIARWEEEYKTNVEYLKMEIDIAKKEVEDLFYKMAEIADQNSDEFKNLQAKSYMATTDVQDFEQQLERLHREFADAKKNLAKKEEYYEVNITPKMREAIAKGLPRFEQGGKVVAETPKISDNPIVHRALMLTGGRPVNS